MTEYPGILISQRTRPSRRGPRRRRLEVRSGEERSIVHFKLEQLEECVGHSFDTIVTDLVDIAVAVYAQDRISERGDEWSRDMSLEVPVRNRRIWDDNANLLTSFLSELTDDVFSITFRDARGSRSSQGFEVTNDRPVCLFSGGIDSYAGAISVLDRKPFLVSHYSVSRIASVQSRLAEFLTRQQADLRHCGVRVALSGKIKEASQLSRSFLFLAIATALAVDLKSSNLLMFENGPISINVPISESRVNTRTAHPIVLDRFNHLLSSVFRTELRVTNPFQLLTKGEVIRPLAGTVFEKKLAESVSCWRFPRGLMSLGSSLGRPIRGNHCGICYPCILRRVAMNSVGLFEKDDEYLVDIFQEYPKLRNDAFVNALDLLRFSHNVRTEADDLTLIEKYSDMSVNTGSVTPRRTVELYRRFSSEIQDCFRERATQRFTSDFASLL